MRPSGYTHIGMAIDTIQIEGPLWERAAKRRRVEWRSLLDDLLGAAHPPWPARDGAVTLGCDDLVLRFAFTASSGEHARVEVLRAELSAFLTEYLGVIDRLGEDGLSMARVEALDMAKRVVHDEAARRLGVLIPDLSEHLETRRRAFSVLVAIVVDTTARPGAHRHR